MRDQVEKLLERIRSNLRVDGCDVVLDAVEGGVIRLRFVGGCTGCPMSQIALLLGIESQLKEAIPGIVRVEAVRTA